MVESIFIEARGRSILPGYVEFCITVNKFDCIVQCISIPGTRAHI